MMTEDQLIYLLALSHIRGLGPVNVKNLIAYCGSPEAVFHQSKSKLMRAPGVGQKVAALVNDPKALEMARKELAYCQAQGIEVMGYLDPDYPQMLKFIHDAPLVLFKKGPVDLNAQPGIAIVGTRKATEYGKEIATEFAAHFSRAGINVVSGLAYGIDITAHRSVLKAGGITTAVLGHGLDSIYPAHHYQKAQEILENGGWLSEYFSGTKPDAPHFPARNRIISGICKAVIVIEAAQSGGALITAKFAFDQNREVYAVPGRVGDPFSEGCNRLIRDQIAKLATGPEEVLADLQIEWQQHGDRSEQLELLIKPEHENLTAQEMKVLNFLGRKEALVDDIMLGTGIPIAELNPLLIAMEFKDLLRQLPGKRYKSI